VPLQLSPNVSNGNYNWDEQLLIILPKKKIWQAKQEELSKVYLDWIESLGVIKICKSCNDGNKKILTRTLTFLDKNTEIFTNELT
jgi:hypothetical protein